MPRSKSQISLPVSLHQEARLLKKFANVSEVKGELGSLLAKAIATLDWLMENGTPGTKLGAAQTVLMPFVPRAPQVVEQLNFDVVNMDEAQQERIMELAKEYRQIVSSPAQSVLPDNKNDFWSKDEEGESVTEEISDGYRVSEENAEGEFRLEEEESSKCETESSKEIRDYSDSEGTT